LPIIITSSEGGEDSVVQTECEILKKNNEEIDFYERNNNEIEALSLIKKLACLSSLSWSQNTYKELRRRISLFRPDVVHFHNIFYMMTPSVYDACRDEGVPIVQSQHNYRLMCSNGLFYRDNHVCEDCLHHSLWEGFKHKCFKNSYVYSFFLARMLMKHKRLNTWIDKVDHYIVATNFTKQKYIQSGLSEKKITVKPHSVFSSTNFSPKSNGYALYVGRLSHEKGVQIMLNAWEKIKEIPLKIMGEGPLIGKLQAFVKEKSIANVEFLGFLAREEYENKIQGAKFLVIPSICYENFPRILSEAYSRGIPVLASRFGSMPELIEEKVTGLTFEAGNSDDLARKVQWANTNHDALREMSIGAKKYFDEKFSFQKNYEILKRVYEKVINEKKRPI